MSSIDHEIDAAVVIRKARAAKFDATTMSMQEWVKEDGRDSCLVDLINRAIHNLQHARILHVRIMAGRACALDVSRLEEDLADAGNLSDLALSLVNADMAIGLGDGAEDDGRSQS